MATRSYPNTVKTEEETPDVLFWPGTSTLDTFVVKPEPGASSETVSLTNMIDYLVLRSNQWVQSKTGTSSGRRVRYFMDYVDIPLMKLEVKGKYCTVQKRDSMVGFSDTIEKWQSVC